VTNALAILRLLPMSDHAKDAEILALRHQVMLLQRQLHGQKVRFTPADRAFLAALLHRLPRAVSASSDRNRPSLAAPSWVNSTVPRTGIQSCSNPTNSTTTYGAVSHRACA
jgi:hypothetical protein